jgi:chromosome segregation ATPase
VVNQWGRDGNSSSSGSHPSGGAGILIAAVIALLIGAGAGYGAARFLSGVSAGDLASRDETIAELRQQVTKLSGARTSDTALLSKIEDLQSQIVALNKANDTLKRFNDEQSGQVSSDAQSEIDALKKTIEEAGNLRSQLSRAQKSLKVSELQLIELEGTVKSQQDEIEKLRSDLSKAASQSNDGNEALSDQIKTLESALHGARQQASTVPDLRKRIAAIEDDLAQKTSDVSAARKRAADLDKQVTDLKTKLDKARADAVAISSGVTDQIKRLQTERDVLQASLDDVRKQLAAVGDGSAEADGLRKDLAAAEEQLAGKDTEISSLRAQTTELKKAVSDANGKAMSIDSQRILLGMNLRALQTEKEKLETENAGLRAAIAELQAKPADAEPDKNDTPVDTDTSVTRDANTVRNALADMPGFSRLTPDKQSDLAARLERGECVADALKASLGRVPAIALRNLIRDLGSEC